jgi:hypothetical protein
MEWDLIIDKSVNNVADFISSILGRELSNREETILLEYGDDESVIDELLIENHPSDKYFTLSDYNASDDIFHIRIWKLRG